MFTHIAGLPNQLKQTLPVNGASAARVGIRAMTCARSGAVQHDAKAHRFPIACGAQHQVQIAREKTKLYFAMDGAEHRFFRVYIP